MARSKQTATMPLCARPLSVGAIEAQLASVVASPPFVRAPRMRRLLAFLVGEALAGRGCELKEYTIALRVFDKPEDFDPASSAVIRVEVGRLRRLLTEYQQQYAECDALEIVIPKGSYVPRIEQRAIRRATDTGLPQRSYLRTDNPERTVRGNDDRLSGLIAEIEGRCSDALHVTLMDKDTPLSKRGALRLGENHTASSRVRSAAGPVRQRELSEAIHYLRMALDTLVALRDGEVGHAMPAQPFPTIAACAKSS